MSDIDTPIDPAHPDETPRSKPVIDLGEWRIAFGRPRYPERICKHRSLVYSTEERRVWCEDCQRTVDNFDALMVLANGHHDMVNTLKWKIQKADEAQKAWLHRKAAKELDQTWGRKMAVACPHCWRRILPVVVVPEPPATSSWPGVKEKKGGMVMASPDLDRLTDVSESGDGMVDNCTDRYPPGIPAMAERARCFA